MIELKPTVKKFKVWIPEELVGESIEASYVLRCPNNEEVRALGEAKNENGLDATVALLERLGLPSVVGWKLDPEYTKQIVEALLPGKKS